MADRYMVTREASARSSTPDLQARCGAKLNGERNKSVQEVNFIQFVWEKKLLFQTLQKIPNYQGSIQQQTYIYIYL